jgi:DNA repair photolyase
MFCTTTDPYQVIHHSDLVRRKELAAHARHLVRRALELIRDESSLNVRILTCSPMARLDFELYRSFRHRLVFGMSLPTLRNDLSKLYEPKAPAPTQRLATLTAAKKSGLHVYVAMAPTYPESDVDDLRATLKAIATLDHRASCLRCRSANADGRFCDSRDLEGIRACSTSVRMEPFSRARHSK